MHPDVEQYKNCNRNAADTMQNSPEASPGPVLSAHREVLICKVFELVARIRASDSLFQLFHGLLGLQLKNLQVVVKQL